MKIIGKTAMIMFVVFLLWVLISWMDVLMHNDPFDGDQHYGRWNAFMLLTEVGR